MARLLLSCVVTCLFASLANAGVTGYYRFPTIHGDTIVFSCEGDLWRVPVSGGAAVRMTTDPGNEGFPRFSPDGKLIAFSGQYDGNVDAYVMDADGGNIRRLSYHPDADEVVGWTPDSAAVVFRSQRQSPHRDYYLYKVPVSGGYPELINIGPAASVAFSPDGKQLAFNRLTREFRNWKRYTGGTAEEIWFGDLTTQQFKPLTNWVGTDRHPMWHNGRVYFLSDRSGRMNIHSCKPDGSDVQQHTAHKDYDARWPDIDGGQIVYMHAGDLYVLNVDSGENKRVDIALPTDRILQRPRFENAAKTLDGYTLSPDGKSLALSSRGELWVSPTKDGRVISLTNFSPSRERGPAFSPDGKKVVAITDQTGEQELAVFDVSGKTEPKVLTRGQRGWIFEPTWSPDGKWLAYADLTMSVMLVDAESGQIRRVDGSEVGEIREYAFSPDGKWLAYAKLEPTNFNSIYLYNIETQQIVPVTTPFTNDTTPAWDPDGKYLYFLSHRHLNPVLGDIDMQHIVIRDIKPCVVILAADGVSPLLPDEVKKLAGKGEEADKDKDDKKDDDKSDAPKLPNVKIDVAGIQQRVVELPVDADNYAGLSAAKGKVFYVSFPTTGLMDDTWPEEPDSSNNVLHVFDFDDKKDEVFIKGIKDYTLTPDGKRIAWRAKDEILVADAGSKPGDEIDEKVDPSSLRLKVQPEQEWAQIFNEAWRLQRDFYWAENMANIDWPAMKEKYGKLLPRISTRDELNDLIGELIAELGTSHTYVFGGDSRHGKSVGVGVLGADLQPDEKADAYRFVRVLRPESWETGIEAPLTMSHANVKDGDYLFAINGQKVSAKDNIYEALADLPGEMVLLTVGGKPDRSDARDIEIETLRSEKELRYRDWCRQNREWVLAKSNGRVGYFHLPDMMGDGLTAFIRGFYPQAQLDGMIVDARYNRGGFVSQMLIERLARKPYAYFKPRRGQIESLPVRTHAGAKCVLINELSGSDGDIFPQSFKLKGLGPVIGMRSWGGVVGIRGDKRFIDGGLSTQPEFAFFAPQLGWDLENHGVDPDIEVVYRPEDYIAGRDPQLERGLASILEQLEANPVKKPTIPEPPDKSVIHATVPQ